MACHKQRSARAHIAWVATETRWDQAYHVKRFISFQTALKYSTVAVCGVLQVNSGTCSQCLGAHMHSAMQSLQPSCGMPQHVMSIVLCVGIARQTFFNKCWPRTASEAQLSACGMPQAKISTCAHCVGGHRNKVGPSISCETFYFFLNGSEIFQCDILWHATSQFWHLQPMRGWPHALCNAIFAAFLWHATTRDEHRPVRWRCT